MLIHLLNRPHLCNEPFPCALRHSYSTLHALILRHDSRRAIQSSRQCPHYETELLQDHRLQPVPGRHPVLEKRTWMETRRPSREFTYLPHCLKTSRMCLSWEREASHFSPTCSSPTSTSPFRLRPTIRSQICSRYVYICQQLLELLRSERISGQSFSTEGHLIVNYRHVHLPALFTWFADIPPSSAQLQLGVNRGRAPRLLLLIVASICTVLPHPACLVSSSANWPLLCPGSQYCVHANVTTLP